MTHPRVSRSPGVRVRAVRCGLWQLQIWPPAGGGIPSSAASATSSGGSGHASTLAYARCLRSHGVPDFTDPDAGGNLQLSRHNRAG
jgi:hypothetical protein